MASRNINTCLHCSQYYCQECSSAEDYNIYCSKSCEREDKEETKDD